MAETFEDKFFESLHKAESDRRDKLESNDSFILAGLSILGSVGIYFAKLLPLDDTSFSWWYSVSTGAYLVLVIIAGLCLVGSVQGRLFAYVSDPGQMRAFAEGLRPFFGATMSEADKVQVAVDSELRQLARSQYAQCASKNRYNNVRKLAWQSWARQFLSIAFIVLIINAFPAFYIERAKAGRPIQENQDEQRKTDDAAKAPAAKDPGNPKRSDAPTTKKGGG